MAKVRNEGECPIKNCRSLAGLYTADLTNPTHFYSNHTGIELLIKKNEARRHFLHAPYQLLVKPEGHSRFYYFSGLYPVTPSDMGADKQNEFRISDMTDPKEGERKGVAYVRVDMFNLSIKPC